MTALQSSVRAAQIDSREVEGVPALTIKSSLLSFVGAAARWLARAHVNRNLPSLCGRYIRELGASGEALKSSLRSPIVLIVGRDGGRACARSLGVLHSGSTSALRRKASGSGCVPVEEDVSAASQYIISAYDNPQLQQTHLLKTGFTCGKYCMCSVCQCGSLEAIWEEVILYGAFLHQRHTGALECRKCRNTEVDVSNFHQVCPT